MKKCFVICLILIASMSYAQTNLKVSLPLIPPLVVNANEGILIDLIKAMGQEYKNGKIEFLGVYPFARSMENVINGQADFHMPILKNDVVKDDKLGYYNSTETIFNVIFALYANKDTGGINGKTVNKFNIGTDRAHTQYFDFKVQPVDKIENGLKMVSAGRLDGFIFAMPETDQVLKQSNIKNIKRMYYKKFAVKMVLPKNGRGMEVDKILSNIIQSLKRKGIYQKIMGPILDQKFEEWQL